MRRLNLILASGKKKQWRPATTITAAVVLVIAVVFGLSSFLAIINDFKRRSASMKELMRPIRKRKKNTTTKKQNWTKTLIAVTNFAMIFF